MKTQIETDTVFREIEEISGERYITIGLVKGRLLVDIVRNSGAKRVLEIGTYIGYSAILIARTLPGDGKAGRVMPISHYRLSANYGYRHLSSSRGLKPPG